PIGAEGERASAAEEVAVAKVDADGPALVAAVAEGEADLAGRRLFHEEIDIDNAARPRDGIQAQVREEAGVQHLAKGLVEFRGVIDFVAQMLEASRQKVRTQPS